MAHAYTSPVVGSGRVCLKALEAWALARAEEALVGATLFLRDMAWTSCGGRLSVIDPPPVVPLLGGLYEIRTGLVVEAVEVDESGFARPTSAPAAEREGWTEASVSAPSADSKGGTNSTFWEPLDPSSLRSRRADKEIGRARDADALKA